MQVNWFLFSLFLIICLNFNVVELKRSFGIGRNRPKVSNPSVRRRGHTSAEAPRPAPQPKKPSAPDGPPPAYSQTPNVAKTHSTNHEAPPSYAQATGQANYPRQTFGGVNGAPNHGGVYSGMNGPSHHQQQMPHYGGHGYAAPPPNYGGYGGYSGGGGYGGYPSGGFGGASPYGMGMQQPYVVQQKSSGFGGVGTHLLTGLAGYQLARAFSGGNSGYHESNQHIYHHYDQNPNVQSQPDSAAPAQVGVSPHATVNTGVSPQNGVINGQVPLANQEIAIPNVPLQPYGNPESADAVTQVPMAEFAYSTIHPSLFPYGRADESMHYWAHSSRKVLNSTNESTTTPTTTSTTATATTTASET